MCGKRFLVLPLLLLSCLLAWSEPSSSTPDFSALLLATVKEQTAWMSVEQRRTLTPIFQLYGQELTRLSTTLKTERKDRQSESLTLKLELAGVSLAAIAEAGLLLWQAAHR